MLDRLLAVVPQLPRPVVFLEDGRGRAGTARLAWGASARFRLAWTEHDIGNMGWLERVARDGRRAYGVASYDLGLPPHASRLAPPVEQPLAEFFVPEREIVVDLDGDTLIAGNLDSLEAYDRVPPAGPPALPPRLLRRSFTEADFHTAVRRIKDHIAEGDVYQVNLAVAESFAIAESAWGVYLRLRQINPSPWMGFADFGDWQVVSGSPELLVEVREERDEGGQQTQRVVRARPIAGTRKKTGDPGRDAVMRSELALDEKEQAEHRMLLDLARNDLGRVASYGSVHVTEREVIEEYSHVFHLVSDVVGELPADRAVWEVIPAVFPGGTITGAPKIRAMEVIADLEPVARGAYTGSLGWIGPEELQLNILIRSAVLRAGIATVQAGAGIVWDSDPAREWRESLRKGEAMRMALGQKVPVETGAHG